MRTSLPSRTVVLSPHLDDGILSLGGAISRASRCGARIRVVTVFAGDVASTCPASGWDLLAGFASEGEAVRARREEDAAACALVGAEPVWLSFSDTAYGEPRNEQAIAQAVLATVQDVDAVLVPGFPLRHRDHRWLRERVLEWDLPCPAVGVYAEQPYRYRVRRRASLIDGDHPSGTGVPDLTWRGVRVAPRDIVAKRRAIVTYRSQLRPLGLARLSGERLVRMLVSEAISGGEAIAWVRPESGAS